MSEYGVVNTIQAPSLEGITQPELIAFEVEFSAYVERVNQVNSERSANNRIKPASLRQCLKPKLLHSLCILGRIPDADSADQATDDKVKQWFDSRLRTETKDLAQRVNHAVNSIQYQLKPHDPAGAPEAYVFSVITALDEHNESSVIKEKDQCKELIRRLATRLEPPELKQRFFNAMIMWTSDEKSNLNHFTLKASSIAEQVSTGEIARNQLKRRGDAFSKHSHSQDNNPSSKKLKTGTESPRKLKDSPPPRPHPKSYRVDKWNKPCLNPNCDEIHRVRECPKTSEAEKKKLIEEYSAKKKATQGDKILSVFTMSVDGWESNGRFPVQIEESMFTALGDTGADHSVLSSDMLSKIREKVPKLEVEPLSPPINFNLAISSSPEISCTAPFKAKLNNIVFLPRTNIPVLIREVEYYVLDQAMNETLLGRSLLRSLGFNLEDHLGKFRTAIDNKSVFEIKQLNLPSLSHECMRYGENRDDPVEPPIEIKSGFGIDSKESIDLALQGIVSRASEHGISTSGSSELNRLLEKYRNVFRIKLGPDPPADVEPLKIQLRPTQAKRQAVPIPTASVSSPSSRFYLQHNTRTGKSRCGCKE